MQPTFEGERMKKQIEQILPNPHRNFDIYPIGETQVQALIDSIEDVGMFLGLPARKTEQGYEIACGHHRLEALKRIGETHVDLAVNDYSDSEMLKIMIRENATQRGNENFGAVLDSVGAVLVECVRDIYKPIRKTGEQKRCQIQINLESGRGIGDPSITEKEPSLSKESVIHALKTFRSTGIYPKLLKKGGLPDEFIHLYEKKPITKIEAVAMFPKPAHAAAWVKGIDDDIFQQKVPIETHTKIVSELVGDGSNTLSAKAVSDKINSMRNVNLGTSDPTIDLTDEPEEKNLDEKASEISKNIKALKNKLEKFKGEKGCRNCYVEDLSSIVDILQDHLIWFVEIRNDHLKTIDI